MDNATTATLPDDRRRRYTAHVSPDEILVTDAAGGTWIPDTAAATEADTAPDPAARIVEICMEAPHRGTWIC